MAMSIKYNRFSGESNGSDTLYHDENDIDEESTPINSTSSENGHTFGIIAPEVIEASSYIYNRSSRTSSVSSRPLDCLHNGPRRPSKSKHSFSSYR